MPKHDKIPAARLRWIRRLRTGAAAAHPAGIPDDEERRLLILAGVFPDDPGDGRMFSFVAAIRCDVATCENSGTPHLVLHDPRTAAVMAAALLDFLDAVLDAADENEVKIESISDVVRTIEWAYSGEPKPGRLCPVFPASFLLCVDPTDPGWTEDEHEDDWLDAELLADDESQPDGPADRD